MSLVVRDSQTFKKWNGEVFGFESLESGPTCPNVGDEGVKLALLQIAECFAFTHLACQRARACHFASAPTTGPSRPIEHG